MFKAFSETSRLYAQNYSVIEAVKAEFQRDVAAFLDKIYETESKASKFLTDVSLKESIGKNLSTQEMTTSLRKILENIKGLDTDNSRISGKLILPRRPETP